MSPLPDLSSLQPDDETRRRRRAALVAALSEPTEPDAVTRRRFVRGAAAVASAGVVLAAGAVVLPLPNGAPGDIVASARAATVADRGDVLHVVVRFHHGPGFSLANYVDARGRFVGRTTGDTESWSTADPPRARVDRLLAPVGARRGHRIETSYADGIVRTRNTWEDVVRSTTLDRTGRSRYERLLEHGSARLDGIGTTGDPLADIRGLLDRDVLRPAGRTDVDGRRVERLTGQEQEGTDAEGRPSPPVRYEVLVDARSYAPVRVTAVQVLPARPHDEEPAARHERRLVQSWTFERVERLPLNATTRRLLTVDAASAREVRTP